MPLPLRAIGKATERIGGNGNASPRKLAAWTTLLLAVAGLMTTIHTFSLMQNNNLIKKAQTGEIVAGEEFAIRMQSSTGLKALAMPAQNAAAILFLAWTFRACRNTRREALGRAPFWGVAAWFIPLVNLYLPYRIIRSVWLDCHPGGETPRFMKAWWALWLASLVLTAIMAVWTVINLLSPPYDSLAGIMTYNNIQISGHLASIAAIPFLIMVIRGITIAQESSLERQNERGPNNTQ